VIASPQRCPVCGELTLVFFSRKNVHRCTNPECGEESLPPHADKSGDAETQRSGSGAPVAPLDKSLASSAVVTKFSSDASGAAPDASMTEREVLAEQHWSVWQDFGPFLDALPSGSLLLSGLDMLAKVTRPEAALAAVAHLFVEGLGYQRVGVDETPRLAGRREFKSLHLVADHRGFSICFIELARKNIFGRFYEAVYRFHPHCLIVSIEPDCRSIRFVYRPTGAPGGRYRTFTGPWALREPNDNLVVWCRRLALLGPRFEDDEASLAERCQRGLAVAPEELAIEWPSAPLPAEGALPGIPWEQTVVRGFRSFIQLGVPAEERLHWGLHALLRNSFPIALARSAATLECRGYCVGDQLLSSAEAEATGRSAAREIELDLVLCAEGIERPFTLSCVLPEPDERSALVLENTRYLSACASVTVTPKRHPRYLRNWRATNPICCSSFRKTSSKLASPERSSSRRTRMPATTRLSTMSLSSSSAGVQMECRRSARSIVIWVRLSLRIPSPRTLGERQPSVARSAMRYSPSS
jgi:hypothetical protein